MWAVHGDFCPESTVLAGGGGGKSDFTVENPDKHNLGQVTKVNTESTVTDSIGYIHLI